MRVVRLISLAVLSILRQERNLVKQKAEMHASQLRYFVLLLLPLVIFLAGCGATPDRVNLFEPPSIIDPTSASHITIATKWKFFYGAGIKYYIELDGLMIAKLGNGQYTDFLVNSGQHKITVCWDKIMRPIGVNVGIPILLGFEREWRDCTLTEVFVAGNEYKFLVSFNGLAKKPTLEKVQSFPKKYVLDPSKLVLPGTK